jgi:predicted dehydrogenase
MNATRQILPAGSTDITRRHFLAGAGAAVLTLAQPEWVRGAEANSRIDIGLIGCGGRGKWIADLFVKDGRYNVVAVADYFADRAAGAGERFQVPEKLRFTGLNGYQRLLEQKLDAVVIETPPYFHPEQAAAAVAAGKHVYLAKPIAVDVPGCQTVAKSGQEATRKKLAFLVDFQTRAHPAYQEAVKRVRAGGIGKLVSAEAAYLCGPTWGSMDGVLRKEPQNPEVRLRAWGVDKILSGDIITEQNIHALDVATWFLDADPIKAYGTGGRKREFLGDCWDHFAVIFHFPEDLVVSFNSKQVGHGIDDILCRVHGTEGTADTHYFGAVTVRSRDDAFNGGIMGNLYTEGAVNNIAKFHESITRGDFSNPTVAPSVRSNLTTILGRMAAYHHGEVTWQQMMRRAEKLEFSRKGLQT